MAFYLAEPIPEAQGKTVDADTTGAAEIIDVAGLLRVGVEGTGTSHKIAAAMVGYGPDYWTRVLGNERGIILGRLGRLPATVQRRFVTAWAHALGLRIERRDAPIIRDAARSLAEAAAKLAGVV